MKFLLLLLTCALFCDEVPFFSQGDEPLPQTYAIASNAPAGILLNLDRSVPEVFVDVAFLYYYAEEEGLNLAVSGQVVKPAASYLATSAVSNGSVLAPSFAYKPAFRVGLGANFAEWLLQGEYTWIRQTINTSKAAPIPDPDVLGVGLWVLNNWFEQTNPVSGQGIAGTDVHSKWSLGMDIADLTLGRPYYQGKRLTVSPSFGLRAAWIRQHMDVHVVTPPILTVQTYLLSSDNSSRCWGLGPITGFDAACLFGKGFRFQGSTLLSILYTQFTHVVHQENGAITNFPSVIGIEQKNLRTVRPEFGLGLGAGWGSYFANGKVHFDLLAGYDFQVFWNQNMMRALLDETIIGVAESPSNLYIEGLNLTARLDF